MKKAKREERWKATADANDILIKQRSQERNEQAQKQYQEDKERAALDVQIAKEMHNEENKMNNIRRENYKKMFADHVKEKEHLNQKAFNSLQPLEFKLNKQKLQTLGFSPEKLNVSIVPKH